ncbi:MAG: HAMP domain-containing histidine kinase [Oscillospiraceae bacterium]|nr:HAMP domain-containing histidine kinase [Oscillospiraceae bacterium]
MKPSKTKIRTRILIAFSSVLFFSFLLTGVIFNFAIRIFAVQGELDLEAYQTVYAEASRLIGRVGLISIILISLMFLMAIIVTYFLANSLTRPIEELGKFALNIGNGDFSQNDFQFQEEELEDLNMALNKSAKQLAEYDSQQKTFFQNASHELRTPLTSIKCYAEGISFGIMEPKQASETILVETDKLADLVTDLLYISKIDNITTVYTKMEINLMELLRDSAARQEAVAEKKRVRFAFDLDDTPIYYSCVSELLVRAIDNLISNAIRYAHSEIVLSCHKREGSIVLSVMDDGDGVENEAIPHLFERFYKGVDGNHGIGLSIAKSIVEQQGGRIAVENAANAGAVFIIILPA